MKTRKETRTIKQTQRYTPTENKNIINCAKQFEMAPSTYIHDLVCNPKMINKQAKLLKCKQAVIVSTATDRVLDLIARTESDYISKSDLIPLVNDIKKGCDLLWKH